MKKLVAILAAVLVSSSVVKTALAHEDQSFLFDATSGIFEENYDLFKFSPAYMPGFETNAFWGQLSNLYNKTDRQFAPLASSSYYLVGGHMDVMGMGRAGLMGDWYSSEVAESVQTWNSGTSSNGFLERNYVRLQDTTGDEQFNLKTESYGRAEKSSKYLNNDIYLAYGMGNISGFDLGIALDMQWNSFNPTYDNNTQLGATYGSFDELGWEEVTDITNPNSPLVTYRRDMECTNGSLSYGDSEMKVVLGARSKGLMGTMPNADLIVNLAPILTGQGNEYEFEYFDTYDNSPNDPNQTSTYRRDLTEKGFETAMGTNYYPASGFGVEAKARLDLATSFTGGSELNNRLITDIHFKTVGGNIDDAKAKQEVIDRTVTRNDIWNAGLGIVNLQTIDNTFTYNYSYEGTMGETTFDAAVRAIWNNKGWDFGCGLKVSSEVNESETTYTYDYNRRYRNQQDNPINTDDYTTTTTEGYTTVTKSKTVANKLILPAAIQLNFLKNFSVQMSAEHTIRIQQSDNSMNYTDKRENQSVQVYDNGVTTSTLTNDTGTDQVAYSNSQYSVTHSNSLAYGVTWWPFEEVRVDIKNTYWLTYVADYQISVSLYF